MTTNLRGRTIAITGASSGIGAATALACAREGMNVVLAARREDRLAQAVALINADARVREAQGRAMSVRADVTNPDDCRAIVDAAVATYGSLFAMFANAGYGLERPVLETSDAEFREMFEVNFFGTLHALRAAAPVLTAAGEGHLILCSSCVAKIGVPYFAAYSASKAMQDHVGRALRHELDGTGVCVWTVHPIGTNTEFFDKAAALSGESWLDHTPASLMQSPDVVAQRIVRAMKRPAGDARRGSGSGGTEIWTRWGLPMVFAASGAFPRLTDWALRTLFRRRRAKSQRASTPSASR
ncbi:MAG: SDR family NAD(P)-dependent oxidoreductase [Planctomycetota bacterium]|nr:SDR family NAD(P)-dependent oxidoreductase [Planctomycetota bacterium]